LPSCSSALAKRPCGCGLSNRLLISRSRSSGAVNREGYAQVETTQELLTLSRKARHQLATDRDLTEEARRALWAIVDARLWFVDTVSLNFDQELGMIEQAQDADLSLAFGSCFFCHLSFLFFHFSLRFLSSKNDAAPPLLETSYSISLRVLSA
jgi:hypothetical protein